MPSPSPPPAAAPFGWRILMGLSGVLLAVILAGLNENVTKMALPDIRGALGMSVDEGSWFVAVYAAASVCAMAFAPWCSVTFSLRRFTVAALIAFAVFGALCPFAPNLPVLLLLRTLQGLAGGALPPMLMTVALRFLPPDIKLYGLGGYALTATFAPSLGIPLAAFCTELLGWRWTFWLIVAPAALAIMAVWRGLPQDPLKLERFRQFDWRGLLLGAPALSMLVLGLLQGDRLDWLNSPLVSWLLGGGVALLVLFLMNEWSHPLPFFKLQLLRNRNLSHALLTLGGVLVVLLGVILIPSSFLAQWRGYRPLETAPVLLMMGLPQLIALPLVAALCNLRRVDCRWVLAAGLALLALSCVLGSQLTPAWSREQFYLLEAVQIFAQPMAVIPLLMLATTGLAPQDGPYASAWFNTVKGFSAVAATGALEALTTWRRNTHINQLADQLGNHPLISSGEGVASLTRQVNEQALILTSADLYLCMAVMALLLIPLIPVIATRVYPPRAASH
ncbi:MFS transporter [Bordetella trematum]|uniref:MFS transporter n=1 Tax=Bordetella trematum TaxID=123899 RepID=UPI000D88FB4D|nr:MFS transporter [Bordetella trematum]SPU53334.1 MFS family transporter [Bordetella trematum]VDH09065.1 Multidrug resistance protein B [Bordetella trematum]